MNTRHTSAGDGKPQVFLVGSTDVDSRIDLMRRLASGFAMNACGSAPELAERFRQANLPYHRYGLSRRATPLADLAAAAQLVHLFRRHRPAVVHAFDTKPCVWARLAARVAGVPVVVGTITGLGTLYVDERWSTSVVRRVYQPLQRLASHTANLTLFYNRDDAAFLIARRVVPAERCLVVPGSGLPLERFQWSEHLRSERLRLRREWGVAEGGTVIIMVARLAKAKGVLHFTAAAERLKQAFPPLRFVLVGPRDTEALDGLDDREMARLQAAVTWLGERRDVVSLLAASDICALPSDREGIPRVLLEGGAMGLPLVATDVAGCRDVVEPNHNGLLVPAGDDAALAEALQRLANDPAERARLGKAARATVEREFAVDAIARRLGRLYSCLLAGKPWRDQGERPFSGLVRGVQS